MQPAVYSDVAEPALRVLADVLSNDPALASALCSVTWPASYETLEPATICAEYKARMVELEVLARISKAQTILASLSTSLRECVHANCPQRITAHRNWVTASETTAGLINAGMQRRAEETHRRIQAVLEQILAGNPPLQVAGSAFVCLREVELERLNAALE